MDDRRDPARQELRLGGRRREDRRWLKTSDCAYLLGIGMNRNTVREYIEVGTWSPPLRRVVKLRAVRRPNTQPGAGHYWIWKAWLYVFVREADWRHTSAALRAMMAEVEADPECRREVERLQAEAGQGVRPRGSSPDTPGSR